MRWIDKRAKPFFENQNPKSHLEVQPYLTQFSTRDGAISSFYVYISITCVLPEPIRLYCMFTLAVKPYFLNTWLHYVPLLRRASIICLHCVLSVYNFTACLYCVLLLRASTACLYCVPPLSTYTVYFRYVRAPLVGLAGGVRGVKAPG